MSMIAVGQASVEFKRVTAICGNCKHEKREHDKAKNRTDRSCGLHGWYVLMSATCTDHEYRQKGACNGTSQR